MAKELFSTNFEALRWLYLRCRIAQKRKNAAEFCKKKKEQFFLVYLQQYNIPLLFILFSKNLLRTALECKLYGRKTLLIRLTKREKLFYS